MIDKIRFNLENCYGIGKLEAELEFKHKGYAIYAPNGVMKTSLAKTMIALSKGEKPEDLAFPERNTICEVTWNDDPIKKEEMRSSAWARKRIAKNVPIIWPDHDEPGLEYARRAASAAARAGAVQVEILKIPPEKPPKWDAADAVEEGRGIADNFRGIDIRM